MVEFMPVILVASTGVACVTCFIVGYLIGRPEPVTLPTIKKRKITAWTNKHDPLDRLNLE